MRGVKRAVTPKVRKGVLWLDFNYKPQWQERKLLKSVGFRWSPARAMWYCQNTTEARQVANKFNLTEFIAKPTPTVEDFEKWQKSLKKSEWHGLFIEANSIFENLKEKNADIAEKVIQRVLQDKFNKQWV